MKRSRPTTDQAGVPPTPGARSRTPATNGDHGAFQGVPAAAESRPSGERVKDTDVLLVIGHDLKDPLAAILMGTNLLLKTASPEDERTVRVLEAIQRAGERLDALIRNALELSKFLNGTFELRSQSHKLEDVLRQACERFAPIAARRAVKLEHRIEVQAAYAVWDLERILLALALVADNAARYTRDGRVTLEARIDGSWARIAIADTGPGIPEDRMHTLFDWVANATRPAREGTGLGLALAKRIIEAHGGTVEVETHIGKGTTCHIALPVAQ
jgi:signal transduction histidine kinase